MDRFLNGFPGTGNSSIRNSRRRTDRVKRFRFFKQELIDTGLDYADTMRYNLLTEKYTDMKSDNLRITSGLTIQEYIILKTE